MLNKKKLMAMIIFASFKLSGMLQAQDSLTTNWLLAWDYGSVDSIYAFEIYRNTADTHPASPITVITKDKDKKDFENKSWRDYHIAPNIHYYYWVRAKDNKGTLSDFSDKTDSAIPKIKDGLTTIRIKKDTTIYLDEYVDDAKYEPKLYKDSLVWKINEKDSEDFGKLRISIKKGHIAVFTISDTTFGSIITDFKVYDKSHPFILYIKKSTIKYVPSGTPSDTTNNPQPPDSVGVGYDPQKETIAYPIPYQASIDRDGITFDNIPPGGSLLIFNMMGDKVFEVNHLQESKYQWDVKSSSGRDLGSGLYMFHVRLQNGNKIDSGKVVIIR